MQSPRDQQRRGRKQHVAYVVQIEGWSWDYYFGLGHPRIDRDGFSDYRHLNICGSVLLPATLAGRTAEFAWVPRIIDMNPRPPPKAVGVLTTCASTLSGNFQMPLDAVPPVLQMLLADRYKHVVIDGDKMFRREAFVWSYYFTGTYDPSEDEAT